MNKILPIIIAIIAAFVILFTQGKSTSVSKLGSHLTCHLNVEDCSYIYNDKQVDVSLSPKPLRAMVPTTLRVKNLGEFENLSVVIKGVNMDMGEIRADFVKKGDTYEAMVMFSACVGDMLYEGVLYSNLEPINFKFELLLGI